MKHRCLKRDVQQQTGRKDIASVSRIARQSLRRCRKSSMGSGTQSSMLNVLKSFCSSSTLVCCPTDLIVLDGISDGQNEAPSGIALLPKDCGRINIKPTRNGPAPLGVWPWIAILYGKYPDNTEQICGGALISERYVLTAYQCFENSLIKWEYVTLGEYNLKTSPDCNPRECAPPHQTIPIERVIPHPDIKVSYPRENDLALIRLAQRPQMYEGFVSPICLPVNPIQDMGFSVEDFEGKRSWGAGWGDTSPDTWGSMKPDILQQVQLPIQTFQHCPKTKSTFCAGGEGNDMCKGDSGNPLTLTNAAGDKVFLIGIVVGLVSNGSGDCGSIGTQSIFTSVPFYTQWIISNLEP
ncbi:serine protease easter-like isoform X1 [Palaemon carinicauda]|uniref:serine protease easter-like isoform X1 n=1 Tax=Palaemon carinicauda TaxID=392227 RepID=UPI0035B6A45C